MRRNLRPELFLLMGADTLEDLPNWRAPERICELAIPVVVRRAGSAEPHYDRWRESPLRRAWSCFASSR